MITNKETQKRFIYTHNLGQFTGVFEFEQRTVFAVQKKKEKKKKKKSDIQREGDSGLERQSGWSM